MRLEVNDLHVSVQKTEILHGISFRVEEGEILSLIGPNGSGKSTLLRTLIRLLKPSSGSVLADGQKIGTFSRKELSRKIALLPQNPEVPEGVTAEQLVEYGRFPHLSLFSGLKDRDHAIVEDVLEKTGLVPLRHRVLSTLSGGERQRAWIGMVFAQDPELLLLDEPTSFLDMACQAEILGLIRKFSREKKRPVLMVLHDVNMALRVSDRVLVMKSGRMEADGTPEEIINPELLFRVFGIRSGILSDPSGYPVIVPRFPG